MAVMRLKVNKVVSMREKENCWEGGPGEVPLIYTRCRWYRCDSAFLIRMEEHAHTYNPVRFVRFILWCCLTVCIPMFQHIHEAKGL